MSEHRVDVSVAFFFGWRVTYYVLLTTKLPRSYLGAPRSAWHRLHSMYRVCRSSTGQSRAVSAGRSQNLSAKTNFNQLTFLFCSFKNDLPMCISYSWGLFQNFTSPGYQKTFSVFVTVCQRLCIISVRLYRFLQLIRTYSGLLVINMLVWAATPTEIVWAWKRRTSLWNISSQR